MRAGPEVLAVVDAPFRGTVERGYADCFHLAAVLAAQLGGLTLLLRGPAAALARPPAPGAYPLDVERLRAAGVRLRVDAASLAALGAGRADVRPGVDLDLGTPWDAFDDVWFV